jgi:hypothetical protein
MPETKEQLPDRLGTARVGLEALLQARAAAQQGEASTAPEAGFRHWGDTPQWYDWHKR